MQQPSFIKNIAGLLAALVLVAGLYSCNDDSKKTETTTTVDTPVFTPPVIVHDSTGKKDSMPPNVIDTEKTEQAPPPRNH